MTGSNEVIRVDGVRFGVLLGVLLGVCFVLFCALFGGVSGISSSDSSIDFCDSSSALKSIVRPDERLVDFFGVLLGVCLTVLVALLLGVFRGVCFSKTSKLESSGLIKLVSIGDSDRLI